MRIDLSGKTALVTASSGGIGFGIASGLAASGAEVIVHGRSQASVDKAIQKLLAEQPDARLTGVAAQIDSAEAVGQVLEAIKGRNVDILINNAGIYDRADFFDADDALWEHFWHTNVMSGVRLARALMPGMMERGWGRVVFISSESARNIPVDMIHYGVSKTALLALARGLAKRAKGSGVTVNSVLPGPSWSDGFLKMAEEEAAKNSISLEEAGRRFVEEHRPSSVIGRPATVEEVANMVVYVASTQASATSGAALRVDGGVVDDIV